MEYIAVLVTSYFRYLASAPKVHWQAGAGVNGDFSGISIEIVVVH
jgi:hypothetical protein